MSAAERKPFRTESEIHGLAATQHGLFTQAQARKAGMTPSAISRRVSAGLWDRVLPGVYRFAGAPISSRQEAKAATLWAGDASLLSHSSAAVCWGIDGVRVRKPELWVPHDCSKQSALIDVHRGTRLDRADRAVLDGVPITSPTRTLIDIAGRLEDEALLAALEHVIRTDLTTPERLAARLLALRTSGRVGAGRLESLLDARPVGASALESRLEAKFWRLLQATTLPRPERQHWVLVDGRRYRLDFAWPEHHVAVECDGRAFHGSDRFEADERRRADLAGAGWLIVPVTWRQCSEQPASVIGRLRRRLGHDGHRFTAG